MKTEAAIYTGIRVRRKEGRRGEEKKNRVNKLVLKNKLINGLLCSLRKLLQLIYSYGVM